MTVDYFNSETGEIISPGDIGTVFKLPNGFFQAQIGNNTWVGWAKSKKAAINQAIREKKENPDKP